MNNPVRIQRKRTKGWKMPEGVVFVGRPTKWGNPYKVGSSLLDVPFSVICKTAMTEDESEAEIITQDLAVRLYRTWLTKHYLGGQILDKAKIELRGKSLACFCSLDKPCHADVLLELLNQGETPERSVATDAP